METPSEQIPDETKQTPLDNEPENMDDTEAALEFSPPQYIDNALPTVAPPPSVKQASTGPNPLNIGFALVIAFAIGLALGFFGRPKIIEDVPVQVIVTVVPNTNTQEVASNNNSTIEPESNAGAQAVASNSNSDTTGSAESAGKNDNSAVEPESDTTTNNTENEVDPNAPPTPTIMDFLMSDARHIQGDEAAPVTIIEFSDFK